MREKWKELLDRKRTYLPWREEKSAVLSVPALEHLLPQAVSSGSHEKDTLGKKRAAIRKRLSTKTAREHAPTTNEQQRARNREKRYTLYKEVQALRHQGLSHYAIADALGLSRPTVRRFLQAEAFPERCNPPRAMHKSIVAPYLPFLRERWLAGCHNGRLLFREAKARGYGGSSAQLERITTQWRKHLPPVAPANNAVPISPPAPQPKRQQISPQQASWYFVLAKEHFTAEQQREINDMCQASQDLALAYTLSQDFATILRKQKANELDDWLRLAGNASVTELRSIAKSMQQDYAAIAAACSQPWSQGQVEGQINRLKCVKRQMYGRARFDLLRLRILLAN